MEIKYGAAESSRRPPRQCPDTRLISTQVDCTQSISLLVEIWKAFNVSTATKSTASLLRHAALLVQTGGDARRGVARK